MLKTLFVAVATVALAAAQVITFSGGPAQTALTSPASNTPPEQRCIVQGQVTNAQTGEPIKKAEVHLVRHTRRAPSTDFTAQQEGYSEVSSADGTFEFDGVEPGEYSLSGERNGYLKTPYGAKTQHSSGTNITLTASQHLTKLALALIPQGVISGRVVDQDGDPVGGAMVMAVRQMWMNGAQHYLPNGTTNSDEDGNYRISNLQAGKYYVLAQNLRFDAGGAPVSPGKPDIRLIRTYYPDAMARDSAAPLSVKAGETLPGIEIRMRSVVTHHIRGRYTGELGASNGMLPVQVTSEDDDEFPFGMLGNQLKADHTFDIAGVAPGKYQVSLMRFSEGLSDVATASVEVGATDVNDVVLVAIPSANVRGQITLEGAPSSGKAADLKSVRVMLMATDRIFFRGGQSETAENGSFTIKNVSPTKYKVQIFGQPTGTYLKSLQFGGQNVPDKELDLSQSVAGELRVNLRYGVAEVSGTLTQDSSGDNQASKTDATVVLIPDSGSGDTHNGSADQNAAFDIREVPPGKYHAVAVAGLNLALLENPDFKKALAAKGIDLELKENDKKQLQIPLLPDADVQRVVTSLGIEGE